jgi:hypothetical protein
MFYLRVVADRTPPRIGLRVEQQSGILGICRIIAHSRFQPAILTRGSDTCRPAEKLGCYAGVTTGRDC